MQQRRTISIPQSVAAVLTTTSIVVAVVLVVRPALARPSVGSTPHDPDRPRDLAADPTGRAGPDLTEPFTLAVVSVCFWHFVVGAAAYSLGFQDDFFYLERLSGDRAIVATQALLLIGLVSFGLAARSGLAHELGDRIGPVVPRGPTDPHGLQVLTWTLLAVGVTASLIGRAQGTFGYIAVANGTIGSVTGFSAMMASASPITALEANRAGATRRATLAMIAGIGLAVVVQAAAAGNRGTALSYALVALVAGSRSLRRFDMRRLWTAALAAASILAIAMAYGSAYRAASTGVDGTVSDDLGANAAEAVDELVDRGPGLAGFVVERVLERLDSVISASVVVEQYRDLDAEERNAGIDDDIVRTTTAAVVPRFLWSGKPSSDPRAVGEVYFGYPNAYAVTPITGLLRNFGPISIPIGMGLVGLALGLAHRVVNAERGWTGARGVVYVLCATRAAGFEGSYASIVPDASRLVAIALFVFGLAAIVARVLPGDRSRTVVPDPETIRSLLFSGGSVGHGPGVGGEPGSLPTSPAAMDGHRGRPPAPIGTAMGSSTLVAALIALACLARIAAVLA